MTIKDPVLYHPEDGSLVIEFVGKSVRLAIFIEEDVDQSGWYFVSKEDTYENSAHLLPSNLRECIKAFIELESKAPE